MSSFATSNKKELDISAIILTWNSERYIKRCVESLIADLNSEYSYEIFIVDNGSTDGTRLCLNELEEQYSDYIKLIFLDQNYGTTYPRNLALKKAAGKYVVVMDSDVEVGKGTTGRLIDFLANDEKIGLVAPRLVYPNGSLQKSTDVFPTIFTKIFRYFFLKAIEKKDKVWATSKCPREVDYAISALWILRSEILETVGLLDENIFYAPEDVDYCLRVWKASYKVLYVPDVTCVHHTQEISRGIKVNKATRDHIRGLIYYFQKHKYLLRRPRIATQ